MKFVKLQSLMGRIEDIISIQRNSMVWAGSNISLRKHKMQLKNQLF